MNQDIINTSSMLYYSLSGYIYQITQEIISQRHIGIQIQGEAICKKTKLQDFEFGDCSI